MRVLHVTPYYAPAFAYGGPPRSIHGLCRALVQTGVDVEVFTTTANGATPLPAAPDGVLCDGIRVRYFPLAAPRLLWNARGMREAIARALPAADVVHIHGLWHRPGYDAARLAHDAGVPYVISPRGMLETEALAIHGRRKAIAWRLFEDRHIRDAALLHATSTREHGTLAARRLGPPIVLAPNGVDIERPAGVDPNAVLRGLGLDPADRFVLFLGRVHPIKRLDLLARAAALLRERDARIVVAGPDENGHRADLAPMFEASGLTTIWAGAVDERQRWTLLTRARALVLCSNSESFGLAAAEAMAAATPVVVTQTCPWEEIERAGAGRWVAHSAEAIAAAIDGILEDPQGARTMGERGRALIARRYAWPATARIIAERYDTLAGRRFTTEDTGTQRKNPEQKTGLPPCPPCPPWWRA
jgi:glycosyltransferase involved in cell wall biosynthesis